ncbi:hypothetical protein L484_017943 [Morus notabilis]|uniref:Uncharacterized protein n=1 Tax=Morus notabilis TaxID=981085 RepID=W9R1V5_9ROSA|nr:hypothetical protein L484_017943 [Morus notabilis]
MVNEKMCGKWDPIFALVYRKRSQAVETVMIVSPTIPVYSSSLGVGSRWICMSATCLVLYRRLHHSDGISLPRYCWLFWRPNPDNRFSHCQTSVG